MIRQKCRGGVQTPLLSALRISAYSASPRYLFFLREIQRALERPLLAVNLLLQLQNGIQQCLRTGGASRHIYIHGNHLVASLHDRVIVEYAARSRASAHGNHPLRLRHLIVELPHHRRHLLREPPGHNHQVRLPRRWTKHFRAESRYVKARSCHRHHLNRAARQPESQRPDRAFARPIHGLIQRGEDDPLIFQQLAEVIRLGQRDVLAQRYAHNPSSWLFSHTRYVHTNLPIIAGLYRQSSSGSPVSPGSPAASSRTARSSAPGSRKRRETPARRPPPALPPPQDPPLPNAPSSDAPATPGKLPSPRCRTL